jgi:hypothetical protein
MAKIAYNRWNGTDYEIYTIPAIGGTSSFVAMGNDPDWQAPPEPQLPTSKADCKHGDYKKFGFKNQGQCVAFVKEATDDDSDDD